MFKEKQRIVCVEVGTLTQARSVGLPGLPDADRTYTVAETSNCDCCDNPMVRVEGLEHYYPHQWFQPLSG